MFWGSRLFFFWPSALRHSAFYINRFTFQLFTFTAVTGIFSFRVAVFLPYVPDFLVAVPDKFRRAARNSCTPHAFSS